MEHGSKNRIGQGIQVTRQLTFQHFMSNQGAKQKSKNIRHSGKYCNIGDGVWETTERVKAR